MTWHYANVWRTVGEAIPDRIAVANGDVRRTWRQYEERAARLAAALVDAGLREGDKIGLYAHNSNEYLEAHYAIMKMGGVPVNVNYRYVDSELTYLLDYADAEALFFDAAFAERVGAVRASVPKLKLLIEVDDGSGRHLQGALRYEEIIAASVPLPHRQLSDDAIYMLFTGGTTGLPKGVMYDQAAFSQNHLFGYQVAGLDVPQTHAELARIVARLHRDGLAPVSLTACPLMHGTGMFLGAVIPHHMGGTVVTYRDQRFDPAKVWRLVAQERVTHLTIVGDALARPLLDTLLAWQKTGTVPDLTSLRFIQSSGVAFSDEVKRGLLSFLDVTIFDLMSSSEGSMGRNVVTRATPAAALSRIEPNLTTKVFADDDREVAPGSDEIGMIGNGGSTPIGYYKDPAKSAITFRDIGGVRYSFPGDFAKVAADGSLVFLGRGSLCINSGGEKIFPEEVEAAVKAHPDVEDCLVVGVEDQRFGERIAAVVSLRSGVEQPPDLEAWSRSRLAGYKVPRLIVPVDEVRRAPNGKADYRWARDMAAAARPG
ncbi:AMP-binding protein [Chelatococcus reniformis]|uniref:Acyl-CoA synthetase n=1 Tax=Chelatococcus reniformis TaxID=1494448 RepID=A0A916XMP2_9HYPH|nr:AMP-binding protein [Chelatococcus reniformis]GGC87478.1 acyl-CoA synthetase [Chelatococcus reniformis]